MSDTPERADEKFVVYCPLMEEAWETAIQMEAYYDGYHHQLDKCSGKHFVFRKSQGREIDIYAKRKAAPEKKKQGEGQT